MSDQIPVDPTPPADPGPGEPMTAEDLNNAVAGFSFNKFAEHEGGIAVSFVAGEETKTVVIDGVEPTDISVE